MVFPSGLAGEGLPQYLPSKTDGCKDGVGMVHSLLDCAHCAFTNKTLDQNKYPALYWSEPLFGLVLRVVRKVGVEDNKERRREKMRERKMVKEASAYLPTYLGTSRPAERAIEKAVDCRSRCSVPHRQLTLACGVWTGPVEGVGSV